MSVLRALVPIVRDLLGTFVFVAMFFATDIYIATACGISLVVGQTIWSLARGKKIGALHWLSLILISSFGALTILFHRPHFIMLKPSLLWFALGIVLLRRDWMAPYLPPIVTDNLEDRLIVRAGYAYSALMFGLAVANVLVVHFASEKFWAVYALVAPTLAQAVLLTALYIRFRKRIVARIHARQAAADALDA
jgi:intracellular septation protein A